VTATPRETRVLDAVVSLVDTLLVDFDVVDLLTELTERCAELLDIASAGFLLADPLKQLRLVAVTSERARELELFQLQADEGPCVDCFLTGQPVSVANLQTEANRWPRFVPTALDAGFASVHAVPMRAAGLVFFRQNVAAQHGIDPQRRKEIRCNHVAVQPFWLPGTSQVVFLGAECAQCGKRVVVFLPVQEIWVADGALLKGGCARVHCDESVGIRIRQRI